MKTDERPVAIIGNVLLTLAILFGIIGVALLLIDDRQAGPSPKLVSVSCVEKGQGE